jgi:DEAD/DEAH box helicase domain-containing protein
LITSDEICVVHTPQNGFGRYLKVPNRCIWTIRSRRPRIIRRGDKTLVYYAKKAVAVPKAGGGEYRDYTYGYRFNMDPEEDTDLARLALAYLMIILRREMGIHFETIMYDVVKIGEDKYFSLHEPESAGLIGRLDWGIVRRLAETHSPDDLDELLLSMVDDIAYSTMITLGFDWSTVKNETLRIIDYILLRDKIKVTLAGRKIEIPRPSPALRLISLKLLYEETDNPKTIPYRIVGLAYYDGLEKDSTVEAYPAIPSVKPPQSLMIIEKKILDKILYDGFKLIVYDPDHIRETAAKAGLRMLQLIPSQSILSLKSLVGKIGIDPFSPGILLETMGLYREEDPALAEEHLSKLKLNPRNAYAARRIGGFMTNEAVKNYILYLALSRLTPNP